MIISNIYLLKIIKIKNIIIFIILSIIININFISTVLYIHNIFRLIKLFNLQLFYK